MQLLTLGSALILPLLFHQGLYHPFWAPKAALVAVLAGPGLVAALKAAARGSSAARLGVAFLASAAISTALSDRPLLAVAGLMNWGTGLVYLIALVGAWALGTRLTAERRAQLEWVLIAAACLNALLAWVRLSDPPGILFSYPGGAAGFTGNSMYLGALCAGGLCLLGDRVVRRRSSLVWLGGVALLAGGAQLSIERASLGLAVLALFVSLRKATLARAAAVGLAALVGFGLAGALAASTTAGASSSTARTFSPQAFSDVRPEVWWMAASEAMRHPVFGVGPGHFVGAVEPHATLRMSAGNVYWTDAHNFVVTSAVTLGLVGTGLLLGWLAVAARRARGPLAGFALIVGLLSMVQPQHPSVTPLALLALGAAGPSRQAGDVTLRGPWLLGAWGLGLAGAAVAGLILFGDMLMLRSLDRFSIADARRASSVLRPWPDPLLLQAQIENHHDRQDPFDNLERPIASARAATRRDPADPNAWVFLGSFELAAGHEEAAADAYRHALLVHPWHRGALLRQAEIAQTLGDQRTRDAACRKLAALKTPTEACGP